MYNKGIANCRLSLKNVRMSYIVNRTLAILNLFNS